MDPLPGHPHDDAADIALGTGVREASLLYLLRSCGVPDELCLAMAMLIFSVSVVFIALIGGLLELGRVIGRRQ